MSQSPDRRPSCGQTSLTPISWMGGCYQHYDTGSTGIKIKRNVTKVPDYAVATCGNPIDPYYRPNEDGGYCTSDITCGDCVNGFEFCNQPDPVADFIPNGDASHSFKVGKYTNYYEDTNETMSAASCHKIGWKSVAAHKLWHGRRGYTSRQGGGGNVDWFNWCGSGCDSWQGYNANDTVKYLSLSANASFTLTNKVWCVNIADGCVDCGDPIGILQNCCTSLGAETWAGSETGNASGTSTVSRTSGNVINSCASSSGTPGNYGGACDSSACTETTDCGCVPCSPTVIAGGARPQEDIDYALAQNALAACNLLSIANSDVSAIYSLWSFSGCTFPDNCAGNCDCTITGGGNSWSATVRVKRSCSTGGCEPTYVDQWDTILTSTVGGTSSTLTLYSILATDYLGCPLDGGCPSYGGHITYTYSFGATTMTYSEDWAAANSASVYYEGTRDVSGTLSSPYTADELYDDVVELLSHFPLDDDDLYPWRTDGAMTTMPFMERDEVGAGPVVACNCQSNTGSSGDIKGLPAPLGMDKVWIPDFKYYCGCFVPDEFGGYYCDYIKRWGAWSTDLGCPRGTNFTNAYDANNLPVGAMVGNGISVIWGCNSFGNSAFGNPVIDDGLWAVKTAQILIPQIQSFNYARPCGEDRFFVSGSSARCIKSSSDGRTYFLDDTVGAPTDIQTGDYVWVCGTADNNGCWKAQRDGDYQITLQTYVISASLVPTQSFSDCGSGMIARIQFQNAQGLNPAICGRIEITDVIKNNPTTCSLANDPFLVDGDKVIVQGAKGLTQINGSNWTVKWVGNTPTRQIALVECNTSSSNKTYTGGATIRSPFAADWKWNDTQHKGDYSYTEWTINGRPYGEWNRINDYRTFHDMTTACSSDPCACSPSDPPACTLPTLPALPNTCYGPDTTEVKCTTNCLPFDACNPTIVAISPNSESFNNSASYFHARVHPFKRIQYDSDYGARWQARINSVMFDPVPHDFPCPCQQITDPDTLITTWECDCSMREDNGTCQADQAGDPDLAIPCIKYYPHRGLFESRCEVPDGAPALKNGVKLGCAPLGNGTNCVDGNYCSPPRYGYADSAVNSLGEACGGAYIYSHWDEIDLPWALYLNMQGCSCAQGRFATDYQKNGILCDDPFVPAP